MVAICQPSPLLQGDGYTIPSHLHVVASHTLGSGPEQLHLEASNLSHVLGCMEQGGYGSVMAKGSGKPLAHQAIRMHLGQGGDPQTSPGTSVR
ncbi:hypothetical protein AMTR_s00063p00033000 [Amborella trichopoda]|uniref:Uncharacterized protein n=1 Tax=Amborella trichopoda TaxID=13333 RepID=U5D784_AMBTC|nr:hypothetical protein AMTR_s00063p00033000 [Amborella trichopoda]